MIEELLPSLVMLFGYFMGYVTAKLQSRIDRLENMQNED